MECQSSEYSGTGGQGWSLPSMNAFGGIGSSDSYDGGAGSVYINCGEARNALLIDNDNRDNSALITVLTDENQTSAYCTPGSVSDVHALCVHDRGVPAVARAASVPSQGCDTL